MKSQSRHYEELRGFLKEIPLIDCHDHTEQVGPKYSDAIEVLISGYFLSDLWSASSDKDITFIQDKTKSIQERWPVLKRAWNRCCYTGYAQVTRLVMKEFYGESELTIEALNRMQTRLLDLSDEKVFEGILDKANIAARLENVYYGQFEAVEGNFSKAVRAVLDGTFKTPPRSKIVIPLPRFHDVIDYNSIQDIASAVDRAVTCLDEYIGACQNIFKGYKSFGAVAFKDPSAYGRNINFGSPTKHQAEEVFNRLMDDPRRKLSCPDESKMLGDYLFNEFMRMARDLGLPVQMHTGHLAGIRNDIANANAIHLRSLIERHPEVRFDLFHANWPYSGELLFLAKNYPNVTIDFCWANIIDPVYCQRLFKQALSSVPHGKIHGYGSDFLGCADRAWAHAEIARDNIAIALSEVIDMDYLGIAEAKAVAYDWLFGNANKFFKLGLQAENNIF